jgi:hypothetical protein
MKWPPTAPRSLGSQVRFNGADPRWFDAPPAHTWPHRVGDFSGTVLTGSSCNCRSIALTPHASGTHTESVAHLTMDAGDVLDVLPLDFLPALLLKINATAPGPESSDYAPEPGDRCVTARELLAAWPRDAGAKPKALVLAVHDQSPNNMPPYLTRDGAMAIVAKGIDHLVVNLPSIDRLIDGGMLTAHRVFFGLPPRAVLPVARHGDARRRAATVTELAEIPADLVAGPGWLQIQAAALSGDAIPSRPLWYAAL